MNKKFIGLLTAITGVGIAALCAQESETAKVGLGTLMVQGKNYSLKHALAYETKIDDSEMIAVVLSGQAVSAEKLKEARAEEKDGHDASFNRPFLKLLFSKAGEFSRWNAGAGDSFMSKGSSGVTAELKSVNGRAIGKASQPNETEGNFRSGFDVHFDVALLGLGDSLPPAKKPGPAANVKPSVTGIFKGNGKDAKLSYVSAHWREPFADKASIVLLFTEKDHSKDKKPDFNTSFGKFGDALVISLHEDGSIFGCEIIHSALQKKNFSSIGRIKADDFSYADGKVEGELTSDGEDEFFGDRWEVKGLKFVAPLGPIPAEFEPKPEKKPEAADKDDSSADASTTEETAGDEKPTAKAAKDQLNVKDLAVNKDATDFEYKAMVEHVLFKTKANVKAACAELTASLKAQGWAKDGSDLITPASCILRRKLGDAELTIFVKPEGAGSEVKIFTKGLSWDEK